MNLYEQLAHDIFIADGGVDDADEMTDADLREIADEWIRHELCDVDALNHVVAAARRMF